MRCPKCGADIEESLGDKWGRFFGNTIAGLLGIIAIAVILAIAWKILEVLV